MAAPDYLKFLPACSDMFKVRTPDWLRVNVELNLCLVQNKLYSPSGSCRQASRILETLLEDPGELLGHWAGERVQVCPSVSFGL